jgi:hypothetical protein
MYKKTIYIHSSYLFSNLSTYVKDLFPTELVTKVKRNINSGEVHRQLSNNRYPVDGALGGGAGSLWPAKGHFTYLYSLPILMHLGE